MTNVVTAVAFFIFSHLIKAFSWNMLYHPNIFKTLKVMAPKLIQ